MNLLELRTEVRRMLRESSATKSTFSDTDINKFVNEAIKDACIKADIYEKTVTQTVLTTIATYVMPWDFLKVVSLRNPSGVDLDQINAADVGKRYIISGKPLYYYLSHAAFTPIIRANLTTYTLGTILTPTAGANGYMYEVTIGGTTGAGAPTYPLLSGSSVADGSATLTCRELVSRLFSLTLVDTPTTAGGGTGTYTLIHSALDEGLYVDTDAPNFPFDKHHFLVDFACFRALSSVRQLKDALPFIMSYCAALGLDLKSYIGGGQAQG
jgi:hypothetical protein